MRIILNKDEIEEAIRDYVKKRITSELSDKKIAWNWFSENASDETNIYEYNLDTLWLEIDLDSGGE